MKYVVRLLVVLCGAGAFAFGYYGSVAIGTLHHGGFNQATAVFVCNEPVGIIASKPNGDSDFLKFDDPVALKQIDAIPKTHRNLLSLNSPACSKKPDTKTY